MASGEPSQSTAPPAESEATRIKKLFSEWWGVVSTVAAAVGTVTAGILGDQRAQAISYPAALILVGLAVFLGRRALQRQRREPPGGPEPYRPAVFVGPNPYRSGDHLPGQQRREEIRAVVDAITDPTFTFGVVTGDLGCGKTSFLDAGVQGVLEESGYKVVLIRSPRQLWSGSPAAGATPGARGRALIDGVRRQVTGGGDKAVLVIDQIEEFFADVKATDVRKAVGSAFEQLIGEGIRIVLGIRWDYGLDVISLSEKFPPLVPQKTLFKLEYFTPSEAAEVIRECAGRDKRVKLDDDFPRTVADDLIKADDGLVRPIELQIVCNALRGSLALTDYRVAGGARGILSRFIQVTVDACPHPQAGRKLLRAMCKFTDKVKADPQTAAQLRDCIGLPGVVLGTVAQILNQFEAAKLLVQDRVAGGGPVDSKSPYRLAHDYLVGPIADVTRQEVTRIEEAEQYLTHYLSEKGSLVPLRRLLFIRRYASPTILCRHDVQKLIRRSLWVQAARAGGLAAGLLIVNAVIWGVSTAERVWDRERIATHPLDTGLDNVGLQQIDGSPSGIFTEGHNLLRKWTLRDHVDPSRPRMAKLDFTDVATGSSFQHGPGGRYILFRPDPRDRKVVALDTTTGLTSPTPFADGGMLTHVAFAEDSDVIAGDDSGSGVAGPVTYRVWSLAGRKELGVVQGARHFNTRTPAVSKNPPRIAISSLNEQNQPSVGLFDYTSGKRLAYLSRGGQVSGLLIDARRGSVYTVEGVARTEKPEDGNQWFVRRWRLSDGVEDPTVTKRGTDSGFLYQPLPGGANLVLRGSNFFTNFVDVLDPDNLTSLIPAGAEDIRYFDDPPAVMWRVGDGAEVWSLRENVAARHRLVGFEWNTLRDVVIRRDAKRLAALHRTGKLDLWNLESGAAQTLRAGADEPGSAENDRISNSIADNCLVESTGPALVRLYDWADGRVLADLSEVGGGEFGRRIHYDGVGRQVYVWTDRGDVMLYTEWRKSFGRLRLWRTGHD
ncbi:MAG TPA: hypothetical protein VD866_02155 [Urbifossiella sp.]|nr:hypothetical protein [Urbifossiella sp.]